MAEITSAGVGYSAAGAGKAGSYLKEKGVMTFYEICEKIIKNGVDVDFDEKQQCPFVAVENTFIGFDNEDRYIKGGYEHCEFYIIFTLVSLSSMPSIT